MAIAGMYVGRRFQSILIFIGPAARTGKGTLVWCLLAEKQLLFLSLDVLEMGLALGIDYQPFLDRLQEFLVPAIE